MKFLVIGYSRFFQRRILPALEDMNKVSGLDIASRHFSEGDSEELELPVENVFGSYRTAIKRSKADFAYVSTVNTDHVRWALKALDSGMHVIVDKPASITLSGAEQLVDAARRNARCIAESTAYLFHPLYRLARGWLVEQGRSPTRMTAHFSFPPLADDNFRYRRDLGGGALADLGPYAVSPGRFFFGSPPIRSSACITNRRHGVESAFSVMLEYSEGRSFVGHFGFETEYRNELLLLGPEFSLEIPRAFTPSGGAPQCLRLRSNNQEQTIEADPGDAFANFLRAFVEDAGSGAHDGWFKALLQDASAREKLERSFRGRRK